jgi:ABC-2 type transport system ATP-binding protein
MSVEAEGYELIQITELEKDYGLIKALKGVSCTIEKGEVVGLLGPNGAGKTTLMKILTGFIQPSSGRATIAGMDVCDQRLEVQKKIGYQPEHAPLYPELTVQDFLMFMARLRGVPSNLRIQRLKMAVERTGLTQRMTQIIGTLSKGYRQRVGLAQAIIHAPEILILDEPTNGLDPSQIVEIRELIKNLAEESTVILSSHILSEVQVTCERILMIINGRLHLDTNIADLDTGRVISLQIHKEQANNASAKIKKLPYVDKVTRFAARGDYVIYKVMAKSDEVHLGEVIFQQAKENDWNLREIRSESGDLELMFREAMKS